MRYEIKYKIDAAHIDHVLSLIKQLPMDFYEQYAPRTIHNIYYDTPAFKAYTENLVGASSRVKLRLRMYGKAGATRSAQLEAKIKTNKLGQKKIYSFESSVGFFDRCKKNIAPILQESLPEHFSVLAAEFDAPALYNTYDRVYFQSRVGNLRVTIDRDLVNQRIFMYEHKKSAARNFFIVECKYSQHEREEGLYFMQHFPFRPQRFSKYVYGMQQN